MRDWQICDRDIENAKSNVAAVCLKPGDMMYVVSSSSSSSNCSHLSYLIFIIDKYIYPFKSEIRGRNEHKDSFMLT